MGGDLVVALGRATVDGHTLFGHNSEQAAHACPSLQLVRGRSFVFGEKVQTSSLELPQARVTYTILGSRPHGAWGLQHGVNEHGVAAGRVPLGTRVAGTGPGLRGTDLVRLALERSQTARQAVDLLTDLVSRHGQAPEYGADGNAFLVADGGAAFVVEAAGRYWVFQEVCEVRALGALGTVRQDWNRIAPGLSEHAIASGWWPADGSKLDFAGAVSPVPPEEDSPAAAALHRWGRATLLLGEQNGHIDTAFMRRVLSDHPAGDDQPGDAEEVSLCRHPGAGRRDEATSASLVVSLGAEEGRLPAAWCAFGPPCLSVYFPVFLDGDLPAAFSRSSPEPCADSFWWRLRAGPAAERPGLRDEAREALGRLQARFDQDAEEFAVEGAALGQRGEHAELQRQATLFTQHCLERFEEVWARLGRSRPAGADAPGRPSPV
jgi:dipeptidase